MIAEHPRVIERRERNRAFNAMWEGFPARATEIIKGLNALASDIRIRVLNHLEVYGIDSIDFTFVTPNGLEVRGEDAAPEKLEAVLRDLSAIKPRSRYDGGFFDLSAEGHSICRDHLFLCPSAGELHRPNRQEVVAFEDLDLPTAIQHLIRLTQLRQISTIQALRYDELDKPWEETLYRGASLANQQGRRGVSKRVAQFMDHAGTQIDDLPYCDIVLAPADFRLNESFETHQEGPGNIGQIVFHNHAHKKD